MEPDIRYAPQEVPQKEEKSKFLSYIRLLLFLVNVSFFLFGASLAAIGVYITVDHGTVSEIIGSSIYSSGSYVLIFAGFVIVFVSLCGCVGFRSKNFCLVITYTIIIFILFLLMFIGAILIFAFRDSMTFAAKKAMNHSLTTMYGRYRLVTDSWNYTQSKLRCCGVDDMSWDVYDNSYWDRFTNANEADRNKKIAKSNPFYRFVPISCCWTLVDPRTGWPTDTFRDINRCQHWQFGPPNHKIGAFNDAIYYRGCFGAGREYLAYHGRFLGGVGICVTLALLCGLVASIIILRDINARRNERLRERYDGGYGAPSEPMRYAQSEPMDYGPPEPMGYGSPPPEEYDPDGSGFGPQNGRNFDDPPEKVDLGRND